MIDEVKSWIVQDKNGEIVVVCPYCKKSMMYPDNQCENCGHEVAMPKKKPKEKAWW